VTLAELQAQREGKTVVFTNGVFDILHAGHVDYLEKARALGDYLVVALNTDATVQAAGAAYLSTPKASPAYDRVDTWLLRAFAGQPKLAVPAFSKTKTATRIFELRDYQSHSEERALSKMAMFDDGEITLMQDLGMAPVFFGQALAGPDLPHLRYITCGPDLPTHLNNWKKFGPDPRWVKMKDDPRYKDNTSKNTARFLVPTAYSQL
jgi:cytidyltransferase-like protein